MVNKEPLDGLRKRITDCKADSACHNEQCRAHTNSSNDRPLHASYNSTPYESLTQTSPYSRLTPNSPAMAEPKVQPKDIAGMESRTPISHGLIVIRVFNCVVIVDDPPFQREMEFQESPISCR